MRVVSKAEAIQLLKDVVAERGEDYVYGTAIPSQCFYSVDGEPSCGVGLAIFKLDPNIFEQVVALEQTLDHSWGADDFSVSADGDDEYGYPNRDEKEVESIPLRFEDDAARVMGVFQSNQDAGTTYALALARALEV